MPSMIIRNRNILVFILSIILVFLFGIILILEQSIMERVILPFLVSGFIASIIYLLLNHFCKDKFCSKIFLISILLHFIFILFWQLLKYYILHFPYPTEYTFMGYVTDLDGIKYHHLGVYISQHFSIEMLSEKMYGGLFSKIIGFIYHYLGINPFYVVCLNVIFSGFIAILLFLIGKITLKSREFAKIFSVLSILNFTHLMNTSTLIRDVYIMLFMYLSLYFSYYFYKSKNLLYIILTLLSLYGLYLFRPYASYIIFAAIIISYAIQNIKIKKQKQNLTMNKITIILVAMFPLFILLIIFLFHMLTHSFGEILSVEDVIAIRETAYGGSNSDFSWDFRALYSKFFLLPFIIGYICLFFAPFPWEWVFVRRMIYIPDMIMFYCFLSSFFKNLKIALCGKQYFLTVFFFSLLIMFTIYSITLGNSGSIHRLRVPYIPMIYLIAMSRPDKFLRRIVNKIQNWRIV